MTQGLLDNVAVAVITAVSPSGTLADVATLTQIDHDLAAFDVAERAYQLSHEPTLAARLEDDFALMAPGVADATSAALPWIEALLDPFVGPLYPLLNVGLQIAVKVALAAYKSWAARRLAQPPP